MGRQVVPQRQFTLQVPRAEGVTNVTLSFLPPEAWGPNSICATQEGLRQCLLYSTSVFCWRGYTETKENTPPRWGWSHAFHTKEPPLLARWFPKVRSLVLFEGQGFSHSLPDQMFKDPATPHLHPTWLHLMEISSLHTAQGFVGLGSWRGKLLMSRAEQTWGAG